MRCFHLVIIGFLLGTSTLKAKEIPQPLYIYDSESQYDFRYNFTVAVVKAALEVEENRLGSVDLQLTKDSDVDMNRARAMALIEQNRGQVHIMSRQASHDLDARFLAIPVSLAGSLWGERIFLMRPERRAEMDRIQTLAELKTYSIGVGTDWVDARVMKAAGFRTESAFYYELLFSMLRGKRFDLLSRGIHEAWDELRLRAFKDLDWQSSLVLSYPAPYYLYVNKQQTELAARLEKGLRTLESDGTLDRLLVEHFGPSLIRANCQTRQRLSIKNPYLPRKVPSPFRSWEDWHQASLLKMSEWCRKARDQFVSAWSGTYRPLKLIASTQGLTNIHAKYAADNEGILVRSAEGAKDTHILSGVFALELALAQSINKNSPYFQRPVLHLIDSDLEQRTALQKLNVEFRPLDAVITQSSLERKKKWDTANFDLARGLMGVRVLVIRESQTELFSKVQDVEDLQRYRICVGSNWPDRKVLEKAGIPTFTRPLTDDLYKALDKGKCDGVLLAVYEARDQILARPLKSLKMEPNLLLSYPAHQQLFVKRENAELVRAAEAGLEVIQRTGVLDELLEVLYGDSLVFAKVERRHVVKLINPDFPELFVQDQLELMLP